MTANILKDMDEDGKWTTAVAGSSTICDTVKDALGNVNKTVEPSPTGRRAAIEHTKRKIRDE